MSIIQLQNINKSYNHINAVSDFNMEIGKGETVVLIGPSGCGKTTLLKCIGVFEKINHGNILFNNKKIITAQHGKILNIYEDLNEYRTKVGMVFQQLFVWPHLTVIENLILGPTKVKKETKIKAIDKAKSILKKFELLDKENKYPNNLSGGQLQRVAIARALIMEPEVLLLDEITSALDPELIGDVLDIIEDLTQGGMTMLIVTHQMYFAEEVADRVIFMDEGSIIEQGKPNELFKNPKTKRLNNFFERLYKHRIYK